ncbi:MAG TPA: hypothetical protein VGR15_09065 [Bacteroidota bacterium]|jgi:chromosome segregation ATPase|nr:hypothetical protein [Bacteroidota bacterium]
MSNEEIPVMEDALKPVWDKIRLAAHLISQLREDKQNLMSRIDDLERQVATLRSEILTRDQEFKRLRSEHVQLVNANGQRSFTEEEKENIRSRIRELISKINSYL